MAANNQFKINQLAKDMGLKGKELTDILGAKGFEVKAQAALSATEFDVLMESLTRASQIENIYDYIDGVTFIPSKNKPEPKKEEVKAEEKKPEPKKVEVKAEEKKTEPKKAEVKA